MNRNNGSGKLMLRENLGRRNKLIRSKIMTDLPTIKLPEDFNYIAAFLTFACTLRCDYCINHHGGDLKKGRWIPGEDWVRGLNRLRANTSLPITLQGGEPTVHKHFYQIVQGINPNMPLDLLTNLEVPTDTFMQYIPKERFKRNSPYASIRVSYHYKQSSRSQLLQKVKILNDNGYSIGIWIVDHPETRQHTDETVRMAKDMNIDIRLKEFLGPYKGKVYGSFAYPEAVDSHYLSKCECKTSELLIGPEGNIYRCHSDLYAARLPIGNLLDPDFSEKQLGQWASCAVYGQCNSCDIKVKYDRFQIHGHSSVKIRDISKPYTPNKKYVANVTNTYGKQ